MGEWCLTLHVQHAGLGGTRSSWGQKIKLVSGDQSGPLPPPPVIGTGSLVAVCRLSMPVPDIGLLRGPVGGCDYAGGWSLGLATLCLGEFGHGWEHPGARGEGAADGV
ncbi:hypothetical protein NDU88_002210 [Pleurodeles waltl]|uniref:Uncharacterized protein n=1 Tax=Pleurodeles waltl TaxID=8319 RepID=A0AAV7TJY6_PLEWA|nr:hypothetical protein NDU88_002210 [Pleurodeles waltl]